MTSCTSTKYCIVVREGPSHGYMLTCRENFVKFGAKVFEICEWTDRDTHTDMLIAILRPISGAE